MQIPDNVRPYVDALVKHHFWLLAALVPCLVLPTVLMATGDLNRKIVAAQGEIDGKLGAVQQVMRNAEHPNEKWAETLRADTKKIKRETFREWERFWDEQAPLRVWPEALGRDFVERASQLQPGGKLPQKLLERYNNDIRSIVRTIPKRMGADEAMREASADEAGPRTARQPATAKTATGVSAATIIRWNASDQKRLYDSFDWRKPPTTAQVQLAQEELWLYGMLCDAIGSMNARSTGAFDSVVPYVEELAVGYPAAEEKPGGRGAGRIIGLRDAAAAPAADTGLPPEPTMDMGREGALGAEGRPPHPRFTAGGAAAEGLGGRGGFGGPAPAVAGAEGAGEAGSEAPAISPDDMLKQWIYVDFTGTPLTAPELATTPDAQMVHLMPFVLRVIVDQRQVDRLLADLAGSPIPIDVRQVRINPPNQLGGEGVFGRVGGLTQPRGGEEGGMTAPGDRRRRPFDVTLELRGTVGLATPPNPAALGAAAPEADPAAAGGGS